VEALKNMDAMAVIRSRSNRIVQLTYDKHPDKDCNFMGRIFGKLKQFKRVATRYEKKTAFMGFVLIASSSLCLK